MAFSFVWNNMLRLGIFSARSRPTMNSKRSLLEAASMLKKLINFALFLFFINLLPVNARAGVPDWLRSAAQQSTKTYADDVNAVVLLNETETTVKDSGETVSHVRKVIKVLRPDGRNAAYQLVPFDDETKLNYLKGWSI